MSPTADIDIVVGHGDPEDPVGKIAVEVDGPTHFVQSTTQPTPHTALKRWLLEREGYAVMPVPYFEWSNLHGDKEYCDYLAAKLVDMGWSLSKNQLDKLREIRYR